MKRLVFSLGFSSLTVLLGCSIALADNDCTEWLGKWKVEAYYSDGSGPGIYYWEVTQADQYVATGIWYPEENHSNTNGIRIVWSTSEGLYLASAAIGGYRDPIQVTILGDSFNGRRENGTTNYKGTRINAANTAGAVVIENNLDITVTGAGLGEYKVDFVLKIFVNPADSNDIYWRLVPNSVKVY